MCHPYTVVVSTVQCMMPSSTTIDEIRAYCTGTDHRYIYLFMTVQQTIRDNSAILQYILFITLAPGGVSEDKDGIIWYSIAPISTEPSESCNTSIRVGLASACKYKHIQYANSRNYLKDYCYPVNVHMKQLYRMCTHIILSLIRICGINFLTF